MGYNYNYYYYHSSIPYYPQVVDLVCSYRTPGEALGFAVFAG